MSKSKKDEHAIVKRMEVPKLPTALQFGFSDELLLVDFCSDEYIPVNNNKISFSSIVLTRDMAETLREALTDFIEDKNS